MKTQLLVGVLLLAVFAPLALAAEDEKPLVVYAKKPTKERIRVSDIDSWKSDNDSSMVLTTKWRDQYLVEFERRCGNLKKGNRSYALVTDSTWLDRNGYIRLLDRDLNPNLFSDSPGFPIAMTINSRSNFCPVKEITALGKKPRVKRADA